MNAIKPEQNGAGTQVQNPVSTAVQNLTFEQSLVKEHAGIDALPGYKVAVFEKLKEGGERFLKVVNRNERFRTFPFDFWNSRDKYFSLAVNESILNYTFEEPVILDDDLRKFTLILHLKYRAADVGKVAEYARHQDPLRRVTDEIAQTLTRSCAQRKWDMIKDRFRELELIALNAERPKLKQFAFTWGIEIIDISLDRRMPGSEKEVDIARLRASAEKEKFVINQDLHNLKDQTLRERTHALRQGEIEQKYDLKSRDLDKQIELQDKENSVHRAAQHQRILDSRDEGIMTVIRNIAEKTESTDDVRDLMEMGAELGSFMQSGQLSGSTPGVLPSVSVNALLGAGEDKVANLLALAMKEIEQSKFTTAQKRSLTSNIMHLLAEAMLDDDANEELMEKHSQKLSELGSTLQFTKAQFRLLERFTNYQQLRDDLR
jgi:hypothetical protein